MGQVGIYSAYQLGIHNHLDNQNGGVLNEYSRDGAYREATNTDTLYIHAINDTAVENCHVNWHVMKQFIVNASQRGKYQITWESRSLYFGEDVRSQIYINDAPFGAPFTHSSNAYQLHSVDYDFDLVEGDLIQIYGAPLTHDNCLYVRHFRIAYNWSIVYFGNREKTLKTPLELTEDDLIDVTADF